MAYVLEFRCNSRAEPQLHAMRLLLRLLITAAALWLAAFYIDGIAYHGSWPGLLVVAVVFGAVNLLIAPIIKLLALPLRILTLGLFTLVINAGMLWLTARLAGGWGFEVSGFRAAFLGALLVSIVSTVLGWFVPDRSADDDED